MVENLEFTDEFQKSICSDEKLDFSTKHYYCQLLQSVAEETMDADRKRIVKLLLAEFGPRFNPTILALILDPPDQKRNIVNLPPRQTLFEIVEEFNNEQVE